MRHARAQWVAAGAIAVLAAAATLLKPLGWDWPWLVAGLALAGVVLAVPNKLLLGRLARRDQRVDARSQELRIRAVGAARKNVRDITDPTVLGVHRAVLPAGWSGEDPGPLPAYVPRDQHEELVALLTPTGNHRNQNLLNALEVQVAGPACVRQHVRPRPGGRVRHPHPAL